MTELDLHGEEKVIKPQKMKKKKKIESSKWQHAQRVIAGHLNRTQINVKLEKDDFYTGIAF